MVRFDASTAECVILTYKEGLLSAVAHDLKILVTDFSIDMADDGSQVTARFGADSMRVVCAMKNGQEVADGCKDKDKREIESNISKTVLESNRHPEIRFVSTSVKKGAGEAQVSGKLTMHGQEKEIQCTAREQGDRWTVEYRLHQPDWGIKPFSAMFGTLKIQADITVRLSVPVRHV